MREVEAVARAIAELMWPSLPLEMTVQDGGAAMKIAQAAIAALDAAPTETADERQAAIVALARSRANDLDEDFGEPTREGHALRMFAKELERGK